MGDRPEGAAATENGTREGDAEGAEGGGTEAESVLAEGGEESRPPSHDPSGPQPPVGLDLAGFKRIYIGKILNPKQVLVLISCCEDRQSGVWRAR